MARSRKRRRSRYSDYTLNPYFGDLRELFRRAVQPSHVAAGAGLALAGGALLKLAGYKSGLTAKLPLAIAPYLGPLSTALAALIMFFTQRSVHRERATGLALGGLVAAGLPVLWQFLQANGPKFTATTADGTPVEVPVFGDYVAVDFGLLTADGPLGLLVEDEPERFRGSEDYDPMSAP